MRQKRRIAGWASLYERLGSRYLSFLLALAGASIAALSVAATVLLWPYGRTSWSVAAGTLVLTLPVMTAAGIVAELVVSRVLRPLSLWLRTGRGRNGAEAAWAAAVGGLWRAVLGGALVVEVAALPPEIHAAHSFGLRTPGTIGLCLSVSTFIATGGMFHLFMWQKALRPVVLDIGRQLDRVPAPGERSLSVGGRVLVLLPLVSVLAGFAAVAFAGTEQSPDHRVVYGLSTASVMGLTLAVGLGFLLRDSLATPLGDLQAAIARVDSGDLTTDVPLTTADELGDVVRNFNQMLAGLREREALQDDLRESRARIVVAGDTARRQVERDLHDGAQQSLVALKLKLAIAERRVDSDPAATRVALQDIRADLGRALDELRDLVHGIYPYALESEGLPTALREAAAAAAMPTSLHSDGIVRYRPELEAAVYFCALEALQNAAKHGGDGACATITLSERDGALLFEITDTGKGFDAAAARTSSGLQNMSDRIGALGGELAIASTAGEGTTVSGWIPLDDPH